MATWSPLPPPPPRLWLQSPALQSFFGAAGRLDGGLRQWVDGAAGGGVPSAGHLWSGRGPGAQALESKLLARQCLT